MKVALINPNIVSQKDDFSGSGIPYMPIALAYLSAFLKAQGHHVQVVDAFGESPETVRSTERHFIQGLSAKEALARLSPDTEFIAIYAHLVVCHAATIELLKEARRRFPNKPKAVLENINKVNAYSLNEVKDEFFEAGANYVILGHLEKSTQQLLTAIDSKTNRVISAESQISTHELDKLPFPDWEAFPLKNYWNLGYSHAPLSTKQYLPLLTSRGCPNSCHFCVNSSLNQSHWSPRSAQNVFDEMAYWQDRCGVHEFHIEDLNPTVNKQRFSELCTLIIKSGRKFMIKLAQGTKLESLDKDLLDKMSAAGFNYVSISPESGSTRVLSLMNKRVDLEHSKKLVKIMHRLGIYSQACFIIGYPGETTVDLRLTAKLIRQLARLGLDELAVFIASPLPGSALYKTMSNRMTSINHATFTPNWRSDFKELSRARKSLYIQYMLFKTLFHPVRTAGYLIDLISGNFHTKVEMTVYRKIRVLVLALKGRLFAK